MDELYHRWRTSSQEFNDLGSGLPCRSMGLGMVSMGLSMVISHGSPYIGAQWSRFQESDPGIPFLRRGGDCIAQWFNQHPDTQTWAQRVSWPGLALSGEAPQVAGDSATNRDCSPSIMGQWGGHISEGGGFFPRTSWWGLGLRVFCCFEDVSRSFGL